MQTNQKTIDILTGANKQYIQTLYKRFLENRSSVLPDWQEFFASLGDELSEILKEEGLEQATDSSLFHGQQRVKSPATLNNTVQECIRTEDVTRSVSALMMIHAYRVVGHTKANLDPLNLSEPQPAPELDPAHFGFTEHDFDREIFIGGALGLEYASLGKILDVLKKTYCGTYAVEFVHCHNPEHKLWIQKHIEGFVAKKVLSKAERIEVLKELIHAETLEQFINTKHVGAKKFGLDGLEAFIPALFEAIHLSAKMGVEEVTIGMAHRGRLNVLCNVMGKPLENLFAEFLGTVVREESTSGDVKYHLGFSTDQPFGDNQLHLSLNSNPSHLEAVDPVVLGKTRAKQDMKQDRARKKVMSVLVHGDAAFIGQGIVAECFSFADLKGYQTGGTLHVVINNQIGFTTNPTASRSSPHCTEMAKIIQAPIFHVNGDDVDSVVFMARLAAEFRATFSKDVVLDIIGYRRFGHNEGDDPTFTQPKMYRKIKEHQSVLTLYCAQLKKEGVVSKDFIDQLLEERQQELQTAYDQAMQGYKAKPDWFKGTWSGLKPHAEETPVISQVSKDQLLGLLKKLIHVPDTFTAHTKLDRLLKPKEKMGQTGQNIDWSTAEALSFATLLTEGINIRLSGQDSVRGTFAQRHAGWVDQESEAVYIPLNHLEQDQGYFEVLNSPLSEFAILGFEYGYTTADPKSLVLWEAQFGDFANGAQVIFDQFISSSEVKWHRLSGLVVLLPHGYEGQGPEHSSARLERYLSMCAENNMSVANCTTPANYFHILRRQVLRAFRKPLILMTPKSLLRHKLVVSSIEEFTVGSSFQPVIDETSENNPKTIQRLIFCSGKVYYDLLAARTEQNLKGIALIRIEELYPFPKAEIEKLLVNYPKNATVIWCQEEPENMGAWTYIDRRLEAVLKKAGLHASRPVYIGRPASAATATGFPAQHTHEQALLVEQALKKDVT